MMQFIWTGCTFSYYIISFLMKYLPGNVYLNSSMLGFSALTYLLQDFLSKIFGAKELVRYSLSLTFIGVIILSQFGEGTQYVYLYAFIIFLIRMAVNAAFGTVYVIHPELFPTQFLASSYGICNLTGRSLNIFSPLIIEAENRMIPIFVVLFIDFLAVSCTYLVKSKQSD